MKAMQIADRYVGQGYPACLVAEIGINHNGDMALARAMVDAAADAGADAVKFQSYATEDFVRDRSVTYTYQSGGREVTETQFNMFKRCELAPSAWEVLKERCDARRVLFHATPTSEVGVQALVEMGSTVLKNGSDYLTHTPLIRAMGMTGLPTVLSTGMATLAEVAAAVDAYRATGNDQLILLHCTSVYPTPEADTNLRRIPMLAEAFQCPVGFSDHTEGTTAAMAAVALGACWIEKHFTLDKGLEGPDHRFSADPKEFAKLVADVRRVESQLGCAEIVPTVSERTGRRDFRLSCAAGSDLPAGHVLSESDVVFSRPGTGLAPECVSMLVGRRLRAVVEAGALIQWELVG